MAGKLVHLVDDVDLVAALARRVLRRLEKLAHLVDARIGRRIHFQQVDEAPGVNFDARRALAARLRRHPCFAIQAFRKDARERRLAYAARTGKEVRVVQALCLERVTERANDVLLADQAREILRSPFARKYLIAHCGRGGEASLTPGTCSDRLWLLPSGPDQVHQTAMRGGPPPPL